MIRVSRLIISLFAVLLNLSPAISFAGQQQDCLQGMSLPPDYLPFSPDSPWNTPITAKPKIDAFSGQMISNLKQTAQMLKGDMTKWTIPLFVIDSESCRKTNVAANKKELNPLLDPDGNGVAEALPVPEGVWPDPESDGHLLLVDPNLGQSWDFSVMKRGANNKWTASRIDLWDLDGPGFREPFKGKYWWTYGARGSGMPLLAGLIRPEEIEAGQINHALAFASPVNRKASFPGGPVELCSPTASRTDGQGEGVEFIPEGARLQLDPALDLNTLNLSKETMIIARALQKYGMYNSDNSKAFKLYFQNLGPDGGKWKTISDFNDLRNIPIEKFRVLKCNVATRKK